MALSSFGYVGYRASDLDVWANYGTTLLGLQQTDRSRTSIAFRMDDRKQRIIVEAGEGGGASFFGWEVENDAGLTSICAKLDASETPYSPMSLQLCQQRGVKDGITFQDPAGNRLEVFYGPECADSSFAPSRAISGFITGPLGLGHIVLYVDNIERAHSFYLDVLGFRLSDYNNSPFKARFYHINARHHSLALIEHTTNSVHHMMMELYHLDDVGQGYDIALTKPDLIATTLGRHSNDYMTSFYTFTPSNFILEYGWGGKLIDTDTWQPYEMENGPSLWGHERSWLTEEGREKARQMRFNAAAKGVREPVYVTEGNFRQNKIACGWWDSVTLGRNAAA
jgi:2,3-dihydroxybiphenyl 1,2-dioxygenase